MNGNYMDRWVIFDLDGTLADITHRLHFIKGEKKDWDSFNAACKDDIPKKSIVELADMCWKAGKKIAVFSGRSNKERDKTIRWLRDSGIHFHMLEMRPVEDFRSDYIVKKEMFERAFKVDEVDFVVDDRESVVAMWRELGLTCLQCQKGDY